MVLGDSYLNLYVGWEGVGLASYLLIGFWNQKPAYATASKKAFVMNRIGDMGLSFAIMIAFATMGTVSFSGVKAAVEHTSTAALTGIGIMLLVAATGKSAQFPLQAWLGDAMAGPTPVSALIHAATMVMHGMNDEVNMRKYGALRRFMPITFATFGLGYLAILGVPPFAGFYSKDMIIETAFNSGGIKGVILGCVTLLGAGITAFYMTRVMILTFTGKSRWDDEAHPHESPWLMWLPMAILAIGSVTSGYLLSHGDALVNWLSPLFENHGEHEELLSPMVVSGLALAMVAIGVAIAFVKYSRNEVAAVAPIDVSIFTTIARQDLLQDRFNEAVFMQPGKALTAVLVKTDEAVIDGAVRSVGRIALSSGSALRGIQSGFVRSYAALILIGAVALVAAIWVVTQ